MINIPGERLQKILANAGLGSRREVEQWIRDGRVKLNGQIAKLGDRAQAKDKIQFDGRPVGRKHIAGEERFVLLYNKPVGELVTRADPQGRPTVFDLLPALPSGRWISVGRLDVNSSGLLLLTNDGVLAERLMHPRYQLEREYAVRVRGVVTPEKIKKLVQGVTLEDGLARFEEIVESGGERVNRWFHVVLMEGRKREVRRMWQAVDTEVSRLKRVRYGPIILDSAVPAGHWRELDKQERKALLLAVEQPADRPWGRLRQASTRTANHYKWSVAKEQMARRKKRS
jgi:23S rRNA pseudouridine2605 synthase